MTVWSRRADKSRRGTRRPKRPRPRGSRPISLQPLEDRSVPANYNLAWSDPQHLTVSFAPDGTAVDGTQSALFQTFNAGAAPSMARHIPNCGAWSGLRTTPTRVTSGVTSLSASSNFPNIENSATVKPVMLPPGCAKLSTSPAPIGSPG